MRQLTWILGILGLAFAGDRLGGFIMRKMTENSQFRYSRLYKQQGARADVLLLGNSRGLTFFQPEIEGLTNQKTLNLSYNGMPMDLGKVLTVDQMQKNGNPKVMLIDVTMCDREDENLIRSFNLYSPYSDSLRGLIKQYDKKVVVGGQVSNLYRYNSELFQRALYYTKKSDEAWLLDRTITPQMAADTAINSYKVRVEKDMIPHLKALVEYAKSQGVTPRLVISPYFPRFGATIQDSFLIPLKQQVEAATGLTVKDYSMALTETADFGDYQHPNKQGAIKYMQMLFNDGMFSPESVDNMMPSSTAYPPVFDDANAMNLNPSKEQYINDTTPIEKLEDRGFMKKTVTNKRVRRDRNNSNNWIAVDTLF